MTVQEPDEAELLRITFDKALNFRKHPKKFMLHYSVQTLCFKSNQKYLTLGKAKLSELIWIFFYKTIY